MIKSNIKDGPVTLSLSIPQDLFYKLEEERANMEKKTGINVSRSAFYSLRLRETCEHK